MRPREQRETGEQDLFRSRLDQIIDLNHPLARLARTVDWRGAPGRAHPTRTVADSSARFEIILPAVLPVGKCRSSGLGRPRTPTATRAAPVLHVTHNRYRFWFIVSPLTLCLLSMATYMPIQFSSGRYPIR
jgi:hypothetical protein